MLYFIVNEKARTGKGVTVWKQVQTELKERNILYKAFKTEYKNHASELARKICKIDEEDICIVVVGGDGTLNEVINGITDFDKVRVSLIPAGSGNDFARGLGIKKQPKERLESILNGLKEGLDACEYIDLGQVEWSNEESPRLYAISSGVGMDALVCKKAMTSKVKTIMNNIGLSKLSYLILTIQSLVSMETANMTVTIEEDQTIELKNGIFGAVMNAKAEGGGVPMAPKASVQDGLLSTCFIFGYTKFGGLLRIPILALGKHEKLKGVKIVDCKKMKIEIEKPMTLHTDGEYIGEVTKVVYTCLPSKLRFLI